MRQVMNWPRDREGKLILVQKRGKSTFLWLRNPLGHQLFLHRLRPWSASHRHFCKGGMRKMEGNADNREREGCGAKLLQNRECKVKPMIMWQTCTFQTCMRTLRMFRARYFHRCWQIATKERQLRRFPLPISASVKAAFVVGRSLASLRAESKKTACNNGCVSRASSSQWGDWAVLLIHIYLYWFASSRNNTLLTYLNRTHAGKKHTDV